MPNGYTHVLTGMKALDESQYKASSLLAFGAGANGPDPLFFHNAWKKNRIPNLSTIATKMHKEKTSAFLTSLVKNADTLTKKSYAAGFLTHYATDKTAHPYVAFLINTQNAPYNIPEGHGFYECTLDSELHKKNLGTRVVKASDATPTPPKEELLEIAQLFHIALLETYGDDISEEMIYKSFHDILNLRKWFTSRIGVKRAIYYIVERLILKSPGYILSNLTPGNKPKVLPNSWEDCRTGEKHTGGMDEILLEAEVLGTNFINKVNEYWNGTITLEEFSAIIGNKSYETGLEL